MRVVTTPIPEVLTYIPLATPFTTCLGVTPSPHDQSIGLTAHLHACTGILFNHVDAVWHAAAVQRLGLRDIATGESHALEEFVEIAFGRVGRAWHNHMDLSEALMRASELAEGRGERL